MRTVFVIALIDAPLTPVYVADRHCICTTLQEAIKFDSEEEAVNYLFTHRGEPHLWRAVDVEVAA
jgi:hypothetical protein